MLRTRPLCYAALVACLGAALISCSGPTVPPAYYPDLSSSLISMDGYPVLVLKGNHQERGHAHGVLMAARIKTTLDDFFITVFFKGNDSLYARGRAFVQDTVFIEEEYRQEAGALVLGMKDAGISLYNAVLGRDLDSVDVLMFNSMEELIDVVGFNYGCSSLSSRGTATAGDSLLKGDLVITRFWDWKPYPQIVNSLLLIVHRPSEPDEQDWVSGSWAGNLGACTGMNGNGSGAFLDYGNIKEYPRRDTVFHPVSLSLRNAIETDDYNGDGEHTTADIVDAVSAFRPLFSSLIHAVAPAASGDNALVVESNNALGRVIRRVEDNTVIAGENLVVTNHFRKLYDESLEPYANKERYRALTDSLAADSVMTADRSWDLLTGAAANAWSLYQVQFIPVSGEIRWRTTREGTYTIDHPYLTTTLAELFSF